MTANQPNLSARARKALDVLADGGRFVERLERNSYTGISKFQIRLTARGTAGVVRGIGRAAFYELQSFIVMTSEGTSVSTYYKLNVGA
jgi:hypothetical protein